MWLTAAIAILIVAALVAVLLSTRDSGESEGRASNGASDQASSSDGGEAIPGWAQVDGTINLDIGRPDDLDARFDIGFPWPTRSVAAYSDASSFLLVVYEDGATLDDVLAFLREVPGDAGWVLASSEHPDPSSRSLGSLTFTQAGQPEVRLHFYDPSGGDQLRFGEEYGVQGPWVEVSLRGEGFG